MIDYEFVKLNQLCSKITDGSHYSPVGIENGIPMLSVKDMLDNRFSYDSCKFVSENDYEELVKGDCKPLLNDVLIAKDGSYLKHVFVIREEIKQAVLSSIGMLRPNLARVNPSYLKYYLQTNSVKETVSKKYVSGSALPRIILKNFGEIDIISKPLKIQNKIAKVLSDLDAKIELNNKINSELEGMAKLLYDYWFVQFDFPDANGKPYKSSGGAMVYNEQLKREIPEGWEVKELKDYANITTGKLDSNAEVENGKYYFYTCAATPTRTNTYAFDDDVILIAGNNAKGNFHVNRYSGKFDAYQRTYVLTAKESIHLNYLFRVVAYQMKVLKSQGKGSQTKFLTLGMISDIPVFQPKTDLMSYFDEIINPLYEKQTIIQRENQKLSELRDWLLPMLMNGQVTVGEAKEYVQAGGLGMAAEEGGKYG
ncbi:MAG: restriction endonuclease subunit S [Reichenbachiella sp.]